MPRARISYGILTSQNQGGGDKKQGLPPTLGKSNFIFNLIKRKAWPTEKEDDNTEDVQLVSVNRAKYLMNYWPDMVLNNTLKDFNITKKIDLTEIVKKIR